MNVEFLEVDKEVDETYWFSVDGQEFGVRKNNSELSLVDYGGFKVDDVYDYSDIEKALFAEVIEMMINM